MFSARKKKKRNQHRHAIICIINQDSLGLTGPLAGSAASLLKVENTQSQREESCADPSAGHGRRWPLCPALGVAPKDAPLAVCCQGCDRERKVFCCNQETRSAHFVLFCSVAVGGFVVGLNCPVYSKADVQRWGGEAGGIVTIGACGVDETCMCRDEKEATLISSDATRCATRKL